MNVVVDDDNNIRSSSLWFDSIIPPWYDYMGLWPIGFWYPSAFIRLLTIQNQLEPLHHKMVS